MTQFDLPLVPAEDVVVRVIEYGERPAIVTRARRDAPQAAIVLAELLAQRRFGQLVIVAIDWTNELLRQPTDPGVAKPVMFLTLGRFFPEKGREGLWLNAEGRIDIDDTFGAGVFDRSILTDLANELGETLARRVREER